MNISAIQAKAPDGAAPVPRYALRSELMRTSLPGNQSTPGLFLIWLNTLCAMVLAVGILGARNPRLFLRTVSALEVPLPVQLPPPPKRRELTRSEAPAANPAPATAETRPQLALVAPVPVIDLAKAAVPRPTLGPTRIDFDSLGTFAPTTVTDGAVGTTNRAGTVDGTSAASPAGVTKGRGTGRGKLGPEDVDYGPALPGPVVAKHGRFEIPMGTRIFVDFKDDGVVSQVAVEPHLTSAGYEREVRDHVRRHWRSKIGAASGYALLSFR